MRRIMRWIVDHPWPCLLLVVVATAVLGRYAIRVPIDVSVETLMLNRDPARAYYDEFKERFGNQAPTMIVVKAADVFAPRALRAVERLSDAVFALDGVTRVDSLTTVNDIRGEGDTINTDALIDGPVPEDPAELAEIRAAALRNPLLVGALVSADARVTALLVHTDLEASAGVSSGAAARQGTAADASAVEFDAWFAGRLEKLIQAERQASGLAIYQVGGSYTKAMLSSLIQRDQRRLFPLALGVLLVVLCLTMRSIHAALIPVTTGLTSVVWAFGWMGLFGYPVTILSGVIPVLLVCTGFTEDVHIIAEFHHERARGVSRLEALQAAAERLAVPLLVTSVTTAVGFASLSLSPVTILSQLGVIAPLGFLSNFVITVCIVPAALRWWPGLDAAADEAGGSRSLAFSSFLELLGEFNRRRRLEVAVLTVAVLAISFFGVTRLRVDNDLMQFFRPSSELRMRVRDAQTSLAGVMVMNMVVETRGPADVLEPRALQAIAKLQSYAESLPNLDLTISLTDYVATMNREMHGGDPAFWKVPSSRNLISQYLVLLYEGDVARYVDYDYSSANVVVRHRVSSTSGVKALIEDLRRYAASEFPDDLAVRFTGETLLLNDAADRLASSMVGGLTYTVLVVCAVNALFFLSLKAGLLSMIPNLLPIAFIVGVMGFLGVPLSVGTAMIAAIAVGIAVDDTVHYMARNSAELDRRHEQLPAMLATLQAEGRAIIATSLAVAAGFAVLGGSSFVPIAHFGLLSAVVMLVAMISDLTITPMLMISTRLVTLWNVVLLKLDADLLKTPLFRGLSRWQARKVVLLGRLERIGAGEYAVREGGRGERDMYMVVCGRLSVLRGSDGDKELLARLRPGDVFGEMALIEQGERSADVLAEEASEVLALGNAELERLGRRFPGTAVRLYGNLARILSERLRRTTRRPAAPAQRDAFGG